MDMGGFEREVNEMAAHEVHIPVAQIGAYPPAKNRAEAIKSCAREYYLRFHVPRELSRVFPRQVPQNLAPQYSVRVR